MMSCWVAGMQIGLALSFILSLHKLRQCGHICPSKALTEILRVLLTIMDIDIGVCIYKACKIRLFTKYIKMKQYIS